jgi:hypothetical protein
MFAWLSIRPWNTENITPFQTTHKSTITFRPANPNLIKEGTFSIRKAQESDKHKFGVNSNTQLYYRSGQAKSNYQKKITEERPTWYEKLRKSKARTLRQIKEPAYQRNQAEKSTAWPPNGNRVLCLRFNCFDPIAARKIAQEVGVYSGRFLLGSTLPPRVSLP